MKTPNPMYKIPVTVSEVCHCTTHGQKNQKMYKIPVIVSEVCHCATHGQKNERSISVRGAYQSVTDHSFRQNQSAQNKQNK